MPTFAAGITIHNPLKASADLEKGKGQLSFDAIYFMSFLHMALIKRDYVVMIYKISFEKSNIGSKIFRCKTL
jgi:hypothetical protein